MLIQCTLLLVEKVGVAPDVKLGSPYTSKQDCRRENHPSFESHVEGHTKSKIGVIGGSTKWTLVQQGILKRTYVKL